MSTIVADGTVPERQWSPNVTTASLARLAQRVVVAAPSGAIAIEAPFTGEPLGEVPAGTQGDVVAAVAAASAAQRDWTQRPLSERAALLLRFHDLAIAHAREALDLTLPILLAMLILLTAESFFANRFYKRVEVTSAP